MKLKNNFAAIIIKHNITGLSTDSRTVKSGDLFFALHSAHIDQAIQNGARFIFCERPELNKKYSVPVKAVKNLRQKIGLFAKEFYQNPSENLHIVGITGTNGKTSCAHFIAQAFEMAGHRSAVMGTLGNGRLGYLQSSVYTTPEPAAVQKLLAEFVRLHVEFVMLEASSQGLDQGRLNGVNIETGIFTNLTRDHLDYHKTLKNYAQAKFNLFKKFNLTHAIFNLDDPYGRKWAERLILDNKNTSKKINIYGIATQPAIKHSFKNMPVDLIFADNIQTSSTGMSANLITPWGSHVLTANLWGKFNVVNLLSAFVSLCIYHIPVEKVLFYLSNLKNPSGRMQIFQIKNSPRVIVDYAHTPDALLKTLTAVREHCGGQIECVFGCGGERDKGKRRQMGQIAEKYADRIILTNDNPRNENPADIINDIRQGISEDYPLVIQYDRKKAVSQAVLSAKENDAVLVAGKGHESYQEIGYQKIFYSDILTVQTLLENAFGSSPPKEN